MLHLGTIPLPGKIRRWLERITFQEGGNENVVRGAFWQMQTQMQIERITEHTIVPLITNPSKENTWHTSVDRWRRLGWSQLSHSENNEKSGHGGVAGRGGGSPFVNPLKFREGTDAVRDDKQTMRQSAEITRNLRSHFLRKSDWEIPEVQRKNIKKLEMVGKPDLDFFGTWQCPLYIPQTSKKPLGVAQQFFLSGE